MKKLSYLALGLSVLTLTACNKSDTTASDASFDAPSRPECIAPAKPGGGFDLTCKLAQAGLKDTGLL